jgi:hypothetical protein
MYKRLISEYESEIRKNTYSSRQVAKELNLDLTQRERDLMENSNFLDGTCKSFEKAALQMTSLKNVRDGLEDLARILFVPDVKMTADQRHDFEIKFDRQLNVCEQKMEEIRQSMKDISQKI